MAHDHVDRVVSVVGEGGVGKTSVAYEAVQVAVEGQRFTRVAWSSASDQHGGSAERTGKVQEYWVDIVKDLGDQLGFDLGLSRALWVPEFRRHVGALNASERLLLVVDNLETLPGATDAINQLREMGIVAPHVILVTTRWELRPHLPGVIEYRVRPLDAADSMRLIQYLGAGDPALSSATESVLAPVLLVTEGNPFLVKLLVQQYLSSHRPLDHVLHDLRQLRDEHEPNLGHQVRSYLYTGSLTELERRQGEQNADALLASFCVKGRGDAFGYEELAGVSGIENARDFGNVLTTACQLSLVTSFGELTSLPAAGWSHHCDGVARDAAWPSPTPTAAWSPTHSTCAASCTSAAKTKANSRPFDSGRGVRSPVACGWYCDPSFFLARGLFVAGRPRALLIFVALPLILATGFLVFLLTTHIVGGDETESAAPPASDTTRSSMTTEVEPKPVACGTATTTYSGGEPIGVADLVSDIHDAACRGDYAALLPLMDETFGGFPKQEVVDGWMTQDSGGDVARTLAQTLETPALGSQGGDYFCHPDGAVAVFSRGTYDTPGSWSDYDPSGRRLRLCEDAG